MSNVLNPPPHLETVVVIDLQLVHVVASNFDAALGWACWFLVSEPSTLKLLIKKVKVLCHKFHKNRKFKFNNTCFDFEPVAGVAALWAALFADQVDSSFELD